MQETADKLPMTLAAAATERPARILVVEDEVVIALDIGQQLREMGYAPVGHATHGEQAVALAAELRPDLVLMDIQLAGEMDGISAAQSIRVELGLPVVFVTAFAADETLARAKLTEPYGYILKPFSEREMRTVIEMALYKHRADTRLEQSLQAQRESALHTQAILDNVGDAVVTIDEQGLIESFNMAACAMFGYRAEEALGQNVAMLMPQLHRSQHDGYLAHYQGTGEARVIGRSRELQGQRQDGSLFPMTLSVSRVQRSQRTTFIGLIVDITVRRQAEEDIHRLANYDPLTELPNRSLLLKHLKRAMAAAGRSGQAGALMFLNLDHFKQVNDHLGHAAGDDLLRQVAARLVASVREADTVARVGGDEFVLVLEALGATEREAAAHAELMAHKLRGALAQPYTVDGKAVASTPSLGIVMMVQEQDDLEALLKQADAAMVQAKAMGRNRMCFFDPATQAAVLERTTLSDALREGLARQEFVLHYQAQVDGSGVTTGAEALLRWNHSVRGMVSPAQFIPLAEETGLILPLGRWVLNAACDELAAWAQDPRKAHWSLSVNVSSLQFAQADFVDTVALALQQSGARADLLKLVLTESMLVSDIEQVIVTMNAVRALGASFSLDDFGTGYSSLSYLKRLPLAQLKIDQSFISDLLTDPNAAVIARTIVSLGHSLGLKVIAEGVETAGQRDYLAGLGCDAFQGFYFGRPGPAATLG